MRKSKGIYIALILFLLCSYQLRAEESADSSGIYKKRFAGLVITGGLAYTGTMIGLNELWYKDYPRSGFHFFNDNEQWLQVDKVGHFTTSYQVGRAGFAALKWSGVKEKKALWYGGNIGMLFLTSVEVFDGFSQQWGASVGDALANAGGTVLFIGQEYLWHEQRITPKYSFHQTNYADLRPDILGENLQQQMLKDYNGQTYWLSFNLHSFFHDESEFPKWINLAIGYGAEGMVSGMGGTCELGNCFNSRVNYFQPVRQYYFSLDLDLARINTGSKFWNTFLSALNFIKIPFPALEYNDQKGVLFRPFYF